MKVNLDFIRNYGLSLTGDRDLLRKLGSISSSLTVAQQEVGTRVLDVGCGHDTEWAGKDNVATPYKREFEPWLSRVAAWSGAAVTGIDYAIQSPRVDIAQGGTWNYLSQDLLKNDEWPLQASSFEVVVLNALVHLENVEHASPRFNPLLPPNTSCDENITWMKRVEQYERVRKTILDNVLRVIKPGGRLIFNHNNFSLGSKAGDATILNPEGEATWNLAFASPEICMYPFEAQSAVEQMTRVRAHAEEFDKILSRRR